MKLNRASTAASSKIVVCPNCGGDSVYAAFNAYRPFCSERCKSVDFTAWASEAFRVPGGDLPDSLASFAADSAFPYKN
jgi:endogenous inhibitor of DNA gyrase (YacG/DUF329 family)